MNDGLQVGRSSLDNTLLKYAAKEYFFKAAVCNFCISPQNAQVSQGGQDKGKERESEREKEGREEEERGRGGRERERERIMCLFTVFVYISLVNK